MSTESFEDRVRERLSQSEDSSGFARAFDGVKQIANSVEEILNEKGQGSRIEIRPDLGFEARIGRQVNVKIVIPERSFQDGLFRVYIPADGFPVQLDLYGEELVSCESAEKMEEELLHFLEQPGMTSRLQQMQEYALKQNK